MRVLVRFFALYRERAGTSQLDVELPEGATSEDLMERLVGLYPALPLANLAFVAINSEYAEPGACLHEGDEVALIPPVSGG